MKVVLLNGYQIRDRRELHTQLARVLELPAWYGGNLDALLDCLADPCPPTVLQILGMDVLGSVLGEDYADSLCRVLNRAHRENPAFRAEWDG